MQSSFFRRIDKPLLILYAIFLILGWVCVYEASYVKSQTSIFDIDYRSGMQFIWICISVVAAIVILNTRPLFFYTWSYIIYAAVVVLLIVTLFVAPNIKGSHSWLVVGGFSIQPAEFAKFATALAVAKLMSTYGFSLNNWKDFASACLVVVLPMVFIVAQKETGSALVYVSFFLMFYREGMSGSFLFTGVAMVVYFVVGVRFEEVMLWQTPTSLGRFIVLLLVQLFTAGMVRSYTNDRGRTTRLVALGILFTGVSLLMSKYIVAFDVTIVQLVLTAALVCWLLYRWLSARIRNYFYVALFAVGSVMFFYSVDYVLNEVMEPHQRVRINVLLGLEEDLAGAGYNVHQSEIAIGSGGLKGKGFLNGTQTKLKFVPEQDTDFIFCTVGEEEGFVGSAAVLLLFLALILRLIKLAERQPFKFGRVYGYCVLSVFLFHLFINVGMVLGLTPVIGIPLPFFSYGGSSLWGFTLLLFIFLRIDASRNKSRRQ